MGSCVKCDTDDAIVGGGDILLIRGIMQFQQQMHTGLQ